MQYTATTNCQLFFDEESPIDLSQFKDTYKKVYVPAKLVKRFNNLTTEEINSLTSINSNIEVARELCYVMANNLNDTFFKASQADATADQINGWKRLKASILMNQLSERNDSKYLQVFNFLQSIGVVERHEQYIIGEKSMSYRFCFEYFTHKMAIVSLKTKKVIDLASKSFLNAFARSAKNLIERETLRTMASSYFYTSEDLLVIGKKIAKKGYITKKGKKLTFLGKNLKSSYKNFDENRVSVEDGVERYKILFETNGIFMPFASENAGGRVATCFNLLPAWIREVIQIDGLDKKDLDYTCLHPNLANNMYGGTGAHVSHDVVVEALYPSSTPEEKLQKRQEVKIEHLSFFNRPLKSGMYEGRWIPGMQSSILFNYYMEKEPKMMENIIKDKEKNGYKHTAIQLFEVETAIMTEVIKRVNSFNSDIRMVYVYDAIEVQEQHAESVKKIMNEVVKKAGINTYVK